MEVLGHVPRRELQIAVPDHKLCAAARQAAVSGRDRRSWAACLLAAVLFVCFWPAFAPAQRISAQELQFYTAPYAPTTGAPMRRNVFLVQINAIVRNREGHAVTGLRRKDFRVYDDGKLQTITLFKAEHAPALMNATRSPSKSRPSPAASKTSHPPTAPLAAPVPRYVALFFDDRSTSFGDTRYAQLAAEKFVRHDLRAGDRVGVFTASDKVKLNFTNDRRKLIEAIKSVGSEIQGPPASLPSPCTHYALGPYASYLILYHADNEVIQLYTCDRTSPGMGSVMCQIPYPGPTRRALMNDVQDVLDQAEITSRLTLESLRSAIGSLAQEPGRRLVVLISPGFFTASLKRGIDAVARDALRANVIIDSLDVKGLTAFDDAPNGNPGSACPMTPLEQIVHHEKVHALDDVMSDLAMDTGGTFFHNDNDLAAGLRQMAAVPKVSYLLGFSPSRLKDNGLYHRLKVKVTAPGSFKVRARRGYFAPGRAVNRTRDRLAELEREVLGSDHVERLLVEVETKAGRLPSGKSGLQVRLRMNPGAVSFRRLNGRHVGQLSLVVALFNRQGRFVTGEQGLVNMELRKRTLDALRKRGLNAKIVLQAPEGRYRLRVVVEDFRNGKMFAATRPASIP